ncbi:MAG: CvpA family protein [Gammaproteobacteria bacterium]
MNGADYLVLSILLVSVGIGVFRGFVREAIGLVAWVLAIWLAWHHSEFIHPWLGGHLQSPEAKAWVARAIVFVGVVLLGDLVGFIASRIAHKAAGLSLVDRFLGLLFGLVRGFVIVGLCALLGLRLGLDGMPWWQEAKLRAYVEYVAETVGGIAGDSTAEASAGADAVPSGD